MGLLDFLEDPKNQLGIGLLAAAGPSAQPMGFGQRLAGALQYAQQSRQGQEEAAYKKAERERQQKAWQREEQIAQLAPQFMRQGSMGQGAVMGDSMLPPEMQTGMQQGAAIPGRAGGFDMRGYANAVMGVDASKGIPLLQALQKDNQFDKIDPKAFTPQSLARFAQTNNYGDLQPRDKLEFVEGVGVNPFDPSNAGRSIPNPNKPFSMGADGQFVPNLPYQKYELGKARAGAANTSVKIENKMGEGLAAQVGPMMRESYTAANGAAQTLDAAARINKAIDSNKLFTGPAAGVRLKAAQIGDMLGIAGKDNAEKIANTRTAIRGLAEMTLQGRKQMTGQGAITESESKLAERATSGDINDLTAAEIKQLALASARSAQFIYGQHEGMRQQLLADPNTAGIAKFYKPMPIQQFGIPQPEAPAGARFLGFE